MMFNHIHIKMMKVEGTRVPYPPSQMPEKKKCLDAWVDLLKVKFKVELGTR